MEKIHAYAKLLASFAFLVLACAALIFSLRYGVSNATAVGVAHRRSGWVNYVFTQSRNGKTLYKWEWNRKKRRWEYYPQTARGK
ncbi:MAG: hypothetical protein AAGJ35_02560 [Myxococcota bacterium]